MPVIPVEEKLLPLCGRRGVDRPYSWSAFVDHPHAAGQIEGNPFHEAVTEAAHRADCDSSST